MSKQKTHEEFLEEFYLNNDKSKNIKILSKYNGMNNKIDCLCLIDNYQWTTTPNKLIHRRQGCPVCAGNAKRTTEEIMSILNNRGFELLSKYKNIHTKIRVRCRTCLYIWETEPNVIINKECGCPKCMNRARKTTESFIQELNHINPNIVVISEYNGANEKISVSCKKCGHSWCPTAWNLLDGHGCPHCNVSSGEDRCKEYFERNKIKYISQKKYEGLLGVSSNRKLSYDFYLPIHNMLIECQGQQHEMPVGYFGGNKQFLIQKEHDKRKHNYAKEHGIDLLEIWYYDYDNIEQILSEKLHINNTEKSA